jgi:hypothetical protein
MLGSSWDEGSLIGIKLVRPAEWTFVVLAKGR